MGFTESPQFGLEKTNLHAYMMPELSALPYQWLLLEVAWCCSLTQWASICKVGILTIAAEYSLSKLFKVKIQYYYWIQSGGTVCLGAVERK